MASHGVALRTLKTTKQQKQHEMASHGVALRTLTTTKQQQKQHEMASHDVVQRTLRPASLLVMTMSPPPRPPLAAPRTAIPGSTHDTAFITPLQFTSIIFSQSAASRLAPLTLMASLYREMSYTTNMELAC
jgi:hypothetical protein